MNPKLWRNLFITLAVAALCIVSVIGLPTSLEEAQNNAGESINLGLDLKGGTYLIMQVQVQDSLRAEADTTIQRLQQELQDQNIEYQSISRNNPETIEDADSIEIAVEGVPTDRVGEFREIVESLFPDWLPNGIASSSWRLNLRPAALSRIKAETVTQSMATIENRVNGLGLTEPTIQQHGRADTEHEILVQLPGVKDPARVMGLLQMSAQLEIQEVRDGPYASQQAALAGHNGVLPPNSEILPYSVIDLGERQEQWYILNRTPVVTGRDLKNARPSRDTNTMEWQAGFTLSREAGVRFGQFTGANVGKPLSVVLDNRIKNVATIQNRITDEGVITGLSGEQEASDLALVLRAGSLPASVQYLEERTVGASLGADSIQQGVQSALLGVALIVVCMLIYYRRAGINANIALFLNLVILMGVLASSDVFTLTLPGIAGIILTIGMAVDANVLIFERIREELRAGKGVVGALNAGFGKAFLTIIDTNLTTIIAALFLFLFGSGPVRGFAVTLAIGLIANLFTSVFVSRLIFDISMAGKKQVKELSI